MKRNELEERVKDIFLHFEIHNEYTMSQDLDMVMEFFEAEGELPEIITADYVKAIIKKNFGSFDSWIREWCLTECMEVTIEVRDIKKNPSYSGEHMLFEDPKHRPQPHLGGTTIERVYT